MGVTKLIRRGMIPRPIYTIEVVLMFTAVLFVVMLLSLVFEVFLVLLGLDEKFAVLIALGAAFLLFHKAIQGSVIKILAPLIRRYSDRTQSIGIRSLRMFAFLFIYIPIMTIPIWLAVVSVAIFWKQLIPHMDPFNYFVTYRFKEFFIVLGVIAVILLEFIPNDWFPNARKFNEMNELMEKHR
ncbi:MAG TPA: hypothetical protein VJJ82_05055 [Candidatus Nanoarchaeia archaeon]|nr:hypothetical protein [Candidatus Nanoarchaeia archaeon]